MPFAIAFPYILIEALAFWGVSKWIGTGWALVALFGFFIGGLGLAAFEMSRIARYARNAGQALGDLGLIAAGSMLVALPGFVSTILGLLLIIPPTRVLVRSLLARQLRMKVEQFGSQAFTTAASVRYGNAAADGRFGDFGRFSNGAAPSQDMVIDEEQIQQWSNSVDPDDFKDPKQP